MARVSNPNNKPYYAEKYLKQMLNTVSLNKLEAYASGETIDLYPKTVPKPEEAVLVSIAAYVYYAKANSLSKIKYPTLYELLNKFIDLKDRDDIKFNKFNQAEKHINALSKSSERDIIFKKKVKEFLIKFMEENNLSINELSKKVDINQSNLQRYLKDEMYNSISLSRIREVKRKIKDSKNE